MGRPKGSKNKPKPDKVVATPKPGVLEQKEQELQQAIKAPKLKGLFQVGRVLGDEWGVFAISKFGGNPVRVFVHKDEGKAMEICSKLNEVVGED